MSSEAAQKAYPKEPDREFLGDGSRVIQRAAFDRGAVEALRQAAKEVRYELGREASGHTSTYSVRNWLMKMADEWERGSA